jgi:pre-mRNA-splicing factor CWC22
VLQTILNVFREDPEYEAHEAQYRAIIKELLGDDDDDEEGGEGDGSGESSAVCCVLVVVENAVTGMN